ncbi:MAG: hypothetical protein A3B30_02160 [Candidatus Komeilibacteria bacterium RIFCSPLOWO2_01_FULL_52_15]|uniref:Peptidase MA-like domain-containing protein n=2 Tax=Candidatus Komeiliibacteriota TaxID=1817908 RepID=A0A1G2BV34_9BACT|nr:MAG: hypothetical protein A2677_00950 [Candidatus Komeilibacteria bacterium RIFCSPHIGHO2_01_FULL_52_14]OGY92140.1 MAG: hypothetical protein A3B30_02160 [Candidatus Komeilibacteria bacterium RIFCSPLOWO2_01_FULL_52_15]
MWLLLCSALLVTNPDPATPEQRWQEAFTARICALEEKHGIAFDRGWVPQVTFDIPDHLHPMMRFQYGASYDPLTRGFMVSPFRREVADPRLIDHELGHALADQVSRRIGNGMWPDMKGWEDLSVDDRIGVNIISEGIGNYFGGPDSNAEEGWLPESSADLTWMVRDFIYHGGHWLVEPIIKRYGERGIAYLVTHRFTFSGGDVRTPAKEYQRKALEELSRSAVTGSQ